MLLSLALATSLWTIVTNQQNPPNTDYLPSVEVKIKGTPTGLAVRDEIKPVRLRVTAPRDVWERLTSASFDAYVDISKAGPGVQDFPVHVETTDTRVRVDEVQPSKITLRLEPVAKKDVPVKLNLVGSVPFGYTSKTAHVSPEQVTVTGPQSLVNLVTAISVEVRLDEFRTSISQPFKPVALNADGEEVQGVAFRPESVFVEVPIEREVSYKTMPIAPRLAGTVSLGYQIVGVMVDPTAVTVVGDPNVLADMSYLPTKPVDVSGIKGDLTAVVEPDLPEGVTLARKQNLSVRVYASAVESSQIFHVAPALKGLGSNEQGSIAQNAVDITLSGPMPVLTTIKPQDIKVVADVTNLGPGAHTIDATVTVPAGLRLDNVSPDKLVVTIK